MSVPDDAFAASANDAADRSACLPPALFNNVVFLCASMSASVAPEQCWQAPLSPCWHRDVNCLFGGEVTAAAAGEEDEFATPFADEEEEDADDEEEVTAAAADVDVAALSFLLKRRDP